MNKYRNRYTGRFTTNPTARAIQYVIAQWIVSGIDRDTDAEVLAVAGGER